MNAQNVRSSGWKNAQVPDVIISLVTFLRIPKFHHAIMSCVGNAKPHGLEQCHRHQSADWQERRASGIHHSLLT